MDDSIPLVVSSFNVQFPGETGQTRKIESIPKVKNEQKIMYYDILR